MKYIKTFEVKFESTMPEIILASMMGNVNKLKELIKSNANVNIQDEFSNTALIVCSEFNNPDIIKILLDAGADPDIKNKHGETALLLAANKNLLENVKLIIDADADWSLKSDNGLYFIDMLSHQHKQDIIKKYPEKYNEFLIKIEAEKYNL